MPTPGQSKVCTKCGVRKPATNDWFYRQSDGKFGFRAQCKTCVREHSVIRKEKIAEYGRVYRKLNKEKIAIKKRQYNRANKESVTAYRREYYKSNREQIIKQRIEYRKKTIDEKRVYDQVRYKLNRASILEYQKLNRTKILKQKRDYRRNFPEKSAANCAKRRAAKLQRTPPWLDKMYRLQIQEVYKRAQKIRNACGIDVQVDHIVPLQGENICGLHVPWNLQILTTHDNATKNNSFDGGW